MFSLRAGLWREAGEAPAGEGHEGVLEAGRAELDVVRAQPGLIQGQDDGVDQVARTAHLDPVAMAGHRRHLRQPQQQLVVEGPGGLEGYLLGPRYLPGQPLGGVGGHDPALVDERHPVAEPLRFLHEMGDQHDGHTAAADVLDQVQVSRRA